MILTLLLYYGIINASRGQPLKNETIIETKSRLLNDLLRDYDKRIEPHITEEPIDLRITILLQNFIELNEKQESMEATFVMGAQWVDPRFTWNSTLYSGLTGISIPASSCWLPPFRINNNHGIRPVDDMTNDGTVYLHGNGNLAWSVNLHTLTVCKVDMKYFPFDSHICKLNIQMGTYGRGAIQLSPLWKGNLDSYGNKEWRVVDSWTKINTRTFSCCVPPMQKYIFGVKLKRNAVYYTHVFISPAVLLALLVPFQFLLPVQSKERITMGSVLALGIILLLVMLQSFLPPAHDTIPVIAMYYSVTLIWIILSILMSVIVISFETRGPRRGKVPNILRKIVLKGLKRLICLSDDTYYALDEREIISMRGLHKSMVKCEVDPNISGAGSKLERDVEEIARLVHNLALRSTILESRKEIDNEWNQLFLIIDRLLFCVFLFVFLIYTLVIMA